MRAALAAEASPRTGACPPTRLNQRSKALSTLVHSQLLRPTTVLQAAIYVRYLTSAPTRIRRLDMSSIGTAHGVAFTAEQARRHRCGRQSLRLSTRRHSAPITVRVIPVFFLQVSIPSPASVSPITGLHSMTSQLETMPTPVSRMWLATAPHPVMTWQVV